MRSNKFGETILNTDDAFDALYQGKTLDLKNTLFDPTDALEKFNRAVSENFDDFSKLQIYQEDQNLSVSEFDKSNQNDWFMPKGYCPNLLEMLYASCTTEEQIQRVNQELELFSQHNMINLLYYLKYLVDTMRQHKIVWGVGRGSSVSSYVLYLIGVHKIDSIKYGLDINEFLK